MTIEDWQLLAIVGGIALAITVASALADRRRMRRSRPDDFGWMPWRGIGFWSLFVAVLFLGLAVRDWYAAG